MRNEKCRYKRIIGFIYLVCRMRKEIFIKILFVRTYLLAWLYYIRYNVSKYYGTDYALLLLLLL